MPECGARSRKMCMEIPCPWGSVVTTHSLRAEIQSSRRQGIIQPPAWAPRSLNRVPGLCPEGKCTVTKASFPGRYQENISGIRSCRGDGLRWNVAGANSGGCHPSTGALSRAHLEKPWKVQLAKEKCGWLALSSVAWGEPEKGWKLHRSCMTLHVSVCLSSCLRKGVLVCIRGSMCLLLLLVYLVPASSLFCKAENENTQTVLHFQ